MILELEIKRLLLTVNTIYRNRCKVRYKTKECREFQDRTAELMRRPEPYTGRASLLIRSTVEDKRRWDIDNRVKALQDCLIQSGVLKDDSKIDTLHVERKYGSPTEIYIHIDEPI